MKPKVIAARPGEDLNRTSWHTPMPRWSMKPAPRHGRRPGGPGARLRIMYIMSIMKPIGSVFKQITRGGLTRTALVTCPPLSGPV